MKNGAHRHGTQRRTAVHRCIVVALGLTACSTNTTVPVGGPCSLDDACSTGICYRDTDTNGKTTPWTHGYCSGNCADSPCPQGRCLALADNSYCVSSCTEDSDCRAGYVCAQAVSACLPDCRNGWSCGSTLTCNSTNGKCEITTLPVGGPCSLDDACSTGICIPGTDTNGKPTPWTNGYCSGNCADSPCPQGRCLALADNNSYCVSSCTEDGDCREGYVCAEAVSACLPDCRNGWSCGSTLTCNSTNGKCEVG